MRLPALLATLPRRVLGKLGVSPKSRNAFSSFRSYLPELVNFAQPRSALEFGPGASSRIILRHSRARLVSLETDAGYLVLFKSRSRFHEVRAHFPPDVRCQCKYCGTPERIEYRRSVAAELGRE